MKKKLFYFIKPRNSGFKVQVLVSKKMNMEKKLTLIMTEKLKLLNSRVFFYSQDERMWPSRVLIRTKKSQKSVISECKPDWSLGLVHHWVFSTQWAIISGAVGQEKSQVSDGPSRNIWNSNDFQQLFAISARRKLGRVSNGLEMQKKFSASIWFMIGIQVYLKFINFLHKFMILRFKKDFLFKFEC